MSIPLKSRNHFQLFRSEKIISKSIIFVYSGKQSESLKHRLFTVYTKSEMAVQFKLNVNEITKELLVNKFNMMLENQGRLMLNTKNSLCQMNRRDLLGLSRSSHWRCSVKRFANFTGKQLLESLFNKLRYLQACSFIKKRLQHWYFPVKFPKLLRTSILRNTYKKLLLFVSPQNTIANSGGEFGLDKTLTECKVSILFFNITILLDEMQPYHLYVS